MALTTKQKALWIIGGIAALLGLGAIWFFFFRGKGDCDPNNLGFTKGGKPSDKCKAQKPDAPTPSGIQWVPESFNLKRGMWGDRIKIMQQILKISDDGKFWTETEDAVKAKIGKTEVTPEDYEKIVNPSTTSGGTNYALLKKELGTSATNFSGGVRTSVLGKNKRYSFDFYAGNGRFCFYETGQTACIKKGTYTNGGKKMFIDGGKTYELGTVFLNMKAIANELGQ